MSRMQIRIPWVSLRAGVAADDAALATFDYASWPSDKAISISPSATGDLVHLLDARKLWLAFYGKAAADATAAYKLYGRRRSNGPIILVASGVLTLGTQAVTKDPTTQATTTALWVDTITVAGGLWKDLAATIIESGTNRIAMVEGRHNGLDGYYLEVDLDGGGGTPMTEVNAIISGCDEVG